jgi:hypothetical protein
MMIFLRKSCLKNNNGIPSLFRWDGVFGPPHNISRRSDYKTPMNVHCLFAYILFILVLVPQKQDSAKKAILQNLSSIQTIT